MQGAEAVPAARDGATQSADPASIVEFHAADLDAIRDNVTRIIKPHKLTFAAGAGRSVNAHNRATEVGAIGLLRLRYGAYVDIDPGPMEPYSLVQVPLSGASPITSGTQSVISTPSLGTVVNAHWPTRLSYSADCEQLILRLRPESLTRQCAQMLGRELTRPLEFDLGFELESDGGRSFLQLLRYFHAEADRPSSLLRMPLAAAQFEQMIMTSLLLAQPHNYLAALQQPQAAVAPYYVKRAEAHIEEHADEPLSVAALAAQLGVSARSLYDGFQRFRGTTPAAYLKQVRLERAHADLLAAASPHGAVTDVAVRWGFGNLGHFAAAYKERFGESPRETLRRWR